MPCVGVIEKQFDEYFFGLYIVFSLMCKVGLGPGPARPANEFNNVVVYPKQEKKKIPTQKNKPSKTNHAIY